MPAWSRLVIFAKAPQAGLAKTRLIPALGATGAAELARQMLTHTLAQALATGAQVELCMSPAAGDLAWRGVALPGTVKLTAQGEGELGERMNRAMNRALTQQAAVLLMGSDCPALSAGHMAEAAAQLKHHDAVLIPAADGGYVLIGLKAPCPEVFAPMAWSTSVVAAETLQRLAALKKRVWLGPTLHDIDDAADLVHLPDTFSLSS
jgi:hypothetical protein